MLGNKVLGSHKDESSKKWLRSQACLDTLFFFFVSRLSNKQKWGKKRECSPRTRFVVETHGSVPFIPETLYSPWLVCSDIFKKRTSLQEASVFTPSPHFSYLFRLLKTCQLYNHFFSPLCKGTHTIGKLFAGGRTRFTSSWEYRLFFFFFCM